MNIVEQVVLVESVWELLGELGLIGGGAVAFKGKMWRFVEVKWVKLEIR